MNAQRKLTHSVVWSCVQTLCIPAYCRVPTIYYYYYHHHHILIDDCCCCHCKCFDLFSYSLWQFACRQRVRQRFWLYAEASENEGLKRCYRIAIRFELKVFPLVKQFTHSPVCTYALCASVATQVFRFRHSNIVACQIVQTRMCFANI